MSEQELFNVVEIIRGTTVDGPGFRTAIYLAGCAHECPGCHNPQSWNPDGGKKMSLREILDIVKEEDFDVTLTGGDPLFNPAKALILVRAIHNAGYGIWLYTGYTYREMLAREEFRALIPYLDAVVDGPFIEELRDTDLQFRGSSNQRIIRFRNPS